MKKISIHAMALTFESVNEILTMSVITQMKVLSNTERFVVALDSNPECNSNKTARFSDKGGCYIHIMTRNLYTRKLY